MKEINANCSICGNKSGYDKESLKGSTWNINGIKVILCCPCEDDLLKKLLMARLPKSEALNTWNKIANFLGI